MKSLARVFSLLLVSSVVTFAESPIDGSWKGEVGEGDAKAPIFMTLRADENAKLTGSVTGIGTELSVQDGTFEGTTLRFKTSQTEGDTVVSTMECVGSLVADTIVFSCSSGGQVKEFTVARDAQ